MAHEIDHSTGRAAFAYVGRKAWHGLGNLLEAGASLDEWQMSAGMDFELQSARMSYMAGGIQHFVDNRFVLYRTDTLANVGEVGGDYRVVQPREILDFFKDLTERQGYELETAGVLKGGRVYWALARTGDNFAAAGEEHAPYVLLSTTTDTTESTTGRRTMIRVVCNNTLTSALMGGNSIVRVPHNVQFDAQRVQAAMGLIGGDESVAAFQANADDLASTQVSDQDAAVMFAELLRDEDALAAAEQARGLDLGAGNLAELLAADHRSTGRSAEDIIEAGGRSLSQLWRTFEEGTGQDTEAAAGTAWGALQAVTNYVDHTRPTRGDSGRMNSAWFGSGSQLKQRAARTVVEYAAAKQAA